MRQWVLSVLYPLRFLFASQPHVFNHVNKILQCTEQNVKDRLTACLIELFLIH